MNSIKLGLLGFGVVGQGIARLIRENGDTLAARIGVPVEICAIAVRDLDKKRDEAPEGVIFTDDPYEVVDNPDVDIVVEVMGGDDPALALIVKAAANRKHIVTANKHLLAIQGETIYRAVEEAGVALGFEAAVAGAIPIVRTLKKAFAANRVRSIYGIVNGTCNYILSSMADDGTSYEEALSAAQELGFAEADPKFDVEGIDSAHKIAILASLAFETSIDFAGVYTEGISQLTPADIELAKEFGYAIKLLAVAKRKDNGIEVRVNPAMVPLTDPIASVKGAYNAIELDCAEAEINTLVGPGAGSGPTASAILGDVADIAQRAVYGGGFKPPMNVKFDKRESIPLIPMDELVSRYYLRFTVPDRPGVLAQLSGALGERNISIASMIQKGHEQLSAVSVVLTTHAAKEADLKAALAKIETLGLSDEPAMVIRIESATAP